MFALAILSSANVAAQSGAETLIARLDAAARDNIRLVSSNAYAAFSAQGLYRQGDNLCTETRQDRAPPFTHIACAPLAELDAATAAIGPEQINIARGEVSFGLAVTCARRPCVREAIVYDSSSLPRLYRLATAWSLACRYRCETMIDDLRRLIRVGGGSAGSTSPRQIEAGASIAREVEPRWPSDPPPPFQRPGERANPGPVLPFKGLSLFATAVCSALKADDPPLVSYRCARTTEIDGRRLRRRGDEIDVVCRDDAPCASGFSLNYKTGELSAVRDKVTSSFPLPCGKSTPLLPYAPCDKVSTLLPYYVRLSAPTSE